jgi:hypothetical protein
MVRGDLFVSIFWLSTAGLAGTAVALGAYQVRRRCLDRWLIPYVLQATRRRAPGRGRPVHVLLCVADHYEPCVGNAPADVARRRVERWVSEYPRLFGDLRDSDGRPPRHTFFVPQDEYVSEHVEGIAELCRAGYGEVEIHLHHDNDTAQGLRNKLVTFKDTLANRHGLLGRRRDNGEPVYAFIHGNWALDNSRPDGRWCGVNNELDVLRETGCYADFTLPSAPSPTQTRKINSIYYAVDDPHRPRSHDTGIAVGAAPRPERALMLIQGPLLLNWQDRKWGLLPRIENANLQGSQPPSPARLDLWLRARVQVPSRPDWFFVKLHTHGAPEKNQAVLLGEPMRRFHQELARRADQDRWFSYHYVTAREMYNLARAAEAGWDGSVEDARDYEVTFAGPPPECPAGCPSPAAATLAAP